MWERLLSYQVTELQVFRKIIMIILGLAATVVKIEEE
jgi:hypothetical protein